MKIKEVIVYSTRNCGMRTAAEYAEGFISGTHFT